MQTFSGQTSTAANYLFIFYIIFVRSYNSLLEVPVLQNYLNIDCSPCLSHRTAVRSSSEEISVTFTECIRLWMVPSYCGKATNYLRIQVDETLKCTQSSVFRNLGILSIQIIQFLGTTQQHLGYYEYLKNININFWNSSALTVLSLDRCLQSGFVTERIRKKHRLPFCGISFNSNSISSHTKVQMLHVFTLYTLLHLSSFVQSVSNLHN